MLLSGLFSSKHALKVAESILALCLSLRNYGSINHRPLALPTTAASAKLKVNCIKMASVSIKRKNGEIRPYMFDPQSDPDSHSLLCPQIWAQQT